MYPLLASAGIVAIAEIGDKTQLLALMLALRYRRAAPILLGILIATLANHALAALAGAWAIDFVPPDIRRWTMALCFAGAAIWALIPDDAPSEPRSGAGPFLVALVSFFLVEFGDKTQFATATLAAQFQDAVLIVLGSTAGLMLADAPAVLLAERARAWIDFSVARWIAGAAFAAMAVAAFLGLV